MKDPLDPRQDYFESRTRYGDTEILKHWRFAGTFKNWNRLPEFTCLKNVDDIDLPPLCHKADGHDRSRESKCWRWSIVDLFFATLSENGNLNDNSFHIPCIQLNVDVFSTRPHHLIDSNCLPFVQLLCFSTSSDGNLIIASTYNRVFAITFSFRPPRFLSPSSPLRFSSCPKFQRWFFPLPWIHMGDSTIRMWKFSTQILHTLMQPLSS